MNRTFLISWALLAAIVLPVQARQRAANQNPAGPEGLQALSEDRVLSELAARNLTLLLDRAFEINQTPQNERAAVLLRIAFAQLRDRDANRTAEQTDRLLQQAARGILTAEPGRPTPLMSVTDPQALLEDANILLEEGIAPEARILEYWGESQRSRERMGPIAEAVVAMYRRAAALASELAQAAANQIRQPNDAASQRYEAYEELSAVAEIAANYALYYQAISLPPGDAGRARVVAPGIEYLRQFDHSDNPRRGQLAVLLGKLSLAGGQLAEAGRFFDQAVADPSAAEDLDVQYEGRFFRAIVDLLSRDLQAARASAARFEQWRAANLPDDPGVAAAKAMLEYRLLSLEAELATDNTVRDRVNASARTILLELLEAQPALRPVILEQLLARIGPNPDVTTLGVLELEALFERGRAAVVRDRSLPLEVAAVELGIAAATELRRRAQVDPGSVPPARAELAAYALGFMYERLDRDELAAEAFITFAEQFPGNVERVNFALNNALGRLDTLMNRARSGNASELAATERRLDALYLRVFAGLTAEPFNRSDLLFEYGRLLERAAQLDQRDATDRAIAAYRAVPQSDPNFSIARYRLMFQLKSKLDATPGSDDQTRRALAEEILAIADQINPIHRARLDQGPEPRVAEQLRIRLAATKVLAADLARTVAGDPRRAIELLADIEADLQGVDNVDDILSEVLAIRTESHLALDQPERATAELVRLFETGGSAGRVNALLVNVYSTLRTNYDRAVRDNDTARANALLRSEAQLTPRLIEWAEGSTNPEHQKYVYTLGVRNADVQFRAAELEPNPDERRRLLERAIQQYTALQAPANFQRFLQTLPDTLTEGQRQQVRFDPNVLKGLGVAHFALGQISEGEARRQQFQLALNNLGTLVQQRAIGRPVNTETRPDGQVVYRDNPLYWEVIYKFIRANLELGADRTQMANFLKAQYGIAGPRTGGESWAGQFEALRAEIAPDFDPSTVIIEGTP